MHLHDWDVSDDGCCTVRSEGGIRYLKYVCVDRGVLQATYPQAGCKGKVKTREPKTWQWWLKVSVGNCTFDHLEASYIMFDRPPVVAFGTRVGQCGVHFATEKYEYEDPLCTQLLGEVQEVNYARNGCLDITGTGWKEGDSYRAGTRFKCSRGRLVHQTFRDYFYCSGSPYLTSVHTWAWFHAYSAGKCVRDIHSNFYLKLTDKLPESWSATVRGCEHAYAAELRPYSDKACSGQFNASGVMEWKSIDWNACISVLASNPNLPLYAQRVSCNGTGLVLDVFADGFCRNDPPFWKPSFRRKVPQSAWLGLLSGQCVSGEPFGSMNFLQLVGLSSKDLTKLSAETNCLPIPSTSHKVDGMHLVVPAATRQPIAPATTRQPGTSTTNTHLNANAVGELKRSLMLAALLGTAWLSSLFP